MRLAPPAIRQVRYACGAVTVCIAALCRGADNQNYFVLCSDRRLDQGTYGADDAATKLFGLGYNWAAMMAGEWSTAKESVRALRRVVVDQGCPRDRAEIVQRISSAAGQFSHSVLCQAPCDLIITGFIGRDPLMLELGLEPKRRPRMALREGFTAIGEGSFAALLMLKYRKYNAVRSMSEACYFVHEAKRFSEVVSSVSHGTALSVHGPLEPPTETRVAAAYVNEMGFKHLNELMGEFWLRPADGRIAPFPDSLFS